MMRMKSKIILGTAIGVLVAAGSVYAEATLKLFINGMGYAPETLDAKIEKGKVMISLDKVAEAFKTKALYDPSRNEIRVSLPDPANLSNQLTSLEDALCPENPEDALQTWVKGIQKRNGAMQYAVLSPELRAKTKAQFDQYYWVTGGSSPHMGEIYNLTTEHLSDTAIRYSFQYALVANYYHGEGSAVVTVEWFDREQAGERREGWYITSAQMADPDDTGLTVGVDPLDPVQPADTSIREE